MNLQMQNLGILWTDYLFKNNPQFKTVLSKGQLYMLYLIHGDMVRYIFEKAKSVVVVM